MAKLTLKKGDSVVIIAGDDKGKTGKILRSFPKTGMVIVEGVNIAKRHQKKKNRDSGKGQIIEKSMPLRASNVLIADPKGGKGTRIGKRFDEKTKKHVRIARKSGTELK